MIKRLSYVFILIFVIIAAQGCSIYRVDSVDTTDEYYPAKSSPDEVIYLQSINRAHNVIAVVTVNAERRQRVSDVIEKMKREAAFLGGDAITNIRTNATGPWKKLPAQYFIGNGYVRANFSADVVIFQ